MGFARIISGGPTGRYTVELDYGDALRTAALAAITSRLTQIDSQILLTQASLIEAEGREDALRADIQSQAEEIIALMQANNGQLGPAGTAVVKYFADLQRRLGSMLAANQPIRDQLSALKFERANWRRKATQFNTMQTKVQRQAWCVDFTEDIPALAYSATCDIPGDPNLVLLAPGGRAWQASDGEFRARELLSPAQAFVNTAIFPGWQKWKPTYRWGTITAIDTAADRLNVALFDQKSDAQRLSVNQTTTLSSVPVDYMGTGSIVFEIGDRVVVQFVGQDWNNPRVIGFVDNPRPVGNWDITAGFSQLTSSEIDPSYSFAGLVAKVRSGKEPTLSEIFSLSQADSLVLTFRKNRGSWQAMSKVTDTSVQTTYIPTDLVSSSFPTVPVIAFFQSVNQQFGLYLFDILDNSYVAANDIIELRATHIGQIILNLALRLTNDGIANVQIVGLLRPSDDSPATLSRMTSYKLFQQTGD